MIQVSAVALGDPAAVHGMLLFGREKIYLSHLPMFHSPHDYQVILEVELKPEAKALFIKDQKDHPEQRLYTLVPQRFVLPDMVKKPTSFAATLVRGHFERGGIEFGSSSVLIKKVIYFKKLDAATKPPQTSKYILFGAWGQAYLAHFISGKPSFDQVLGAEVKNVKLAKLIESKPFVVVQIPDRSDEKPLKERTPVTALATGEDGTKDILVPLNEFYLEFDDLG